MGVADGAPNGRASRAASEGRAHAERDWHLCDGGPPGELSDVQGARCTVRRRRIAIPMCPGVAVRAARSAELGC